MQIEDELMDLAKNTPGKHYTMKIHDRVGGKTITVDQTLDSDIKGTVEEINRLVNMIASTLKYIGDKTYPEIFGNVYLQHLTVGEYQIDFEGCAGETAFKLMKRYFNVLLNSMNEQRLLKWEAENEQKESANTEATKQ